MQRSEKLLVILGMPRGRQRGTGRSGRSGCNSSSKLYRDEQRWAERVRSASRAVLLVAMLERLVRRNRLGLRFVLPRRLEVVQVQRLRSASLQARQQPLRLANHLHLGRIQHQWRQEARLAAHLRSEVQLLPQHQRSARTISLLPTHLPLSARQKQKQHQHLEVVLLLPLPHLDRLALALLQRSHLHSAVAQPLQPLADRPLRLVPPPLRLAMRQQQSCTKTRTELRCQQRIN